jgi:CubicO group peptidase (beta-lactamase class C family)
VAYAAGTLNSNVLDLIAWDAAYFGGKVVSAASVREMTTAPEIAGRAGDYGFGWILGTVYGRRELWHNGGIPGFSARNAYFPEDRISIAVLANSMEFDAGPIVREALAAAENLTAAERAPFDAPSPAPGEDPKITALARAQFDALRSGTLERSAFTAAMNDALTPELIERARASLADLGPAFRFTFVSRSKQGTVDTYVYKIDCTQGAARELLTVDAAGKIAGLYFRPWDG